MSEPSRAAPQRAAIPSGHARARRRAALTWPPALALSLALLTALLGGCRRAPPVPALAPEQVTFEADALTLTLPAGHGWDMLALLDARGDVLLEQPLPPGTPLPVRFDVPWQPGEELALRASREGRPSRTLALRAPGQPAPAIDAELHLPPGLAVPPGESPLLLPAGAQGELALVLRSRRDVPQRLRVRLTLHGGLRATADANPGTPPTSADDGTTIERTLTLRFRADEASLHVPFRVEAHPLPHAGAATGQALAWAGWDESGARLFGGARSIAVLPGAVLSAKLTVEATRFPADAAGNALPQLPRETWVLEHPAVAWLWRVLGAGAARDPYAPVAYAAHVLRNGLDGDVVAAVRQRFMPAASGAEDRAASSAALRNPLQRGDDDALALVHLSAHGTAQLVQPVFVNPAAPAGFHRRCVEVAPWGLTTGASRRCADFALRLPPLGAWLGLWIATLASLALTAWALARLSRWARAFPLRDLVLIALTAGMAFLLVSVPNLVLQALTTFLLGPFFFLVNDLLFKGLFFLLAGVLVTQVRRPGTYLLFFALWMVAQAVLNGHYAPTVLLFGGISVLLIEAALWLGGLTRRGPTAAEQAEPAAPGRALAWRVALLAGLAEGAVILWHMALIKALYRVFLADWFVLLQGVSGGVHTAIGMGLGLRLGALLLPLRRPLDAHEALPHQPGARLSAGPPPPAHGLAASAAPTPALQAAGLTYVYPGAAAPALRDVAFTLAPGEIVLLAGPSGGGKTTLLRVLQGLLARPPGMTLSLDGQPAGGMSRARWAARCGLLFQEPGLQVVRPTVRGELAFAHELLGVAPDEARCSALLARFGVAHLRERATDALSGGELQRVALAALCAGQPAVLLLDEPLAHQDAEGRARLFDTLHALASAGVAVLVAEHRLEPLLAHVSRVLWLEQGRIAWSGDPAAFRASAPFRRMQAALAPARLAALAASRTDAARPAACGAAHPIVAAHDLRFAYGRGAPAVLRGVNVALHPGRHVALLGLNGAGKSTLLELLLGLRAPTAGVVLARGLRGGRADDSRPTLPVHRVSWRERGRLFGLLPQQADLLLHARTLHEELAFAPRRRGLPPAQVEALVASWLRRLNLHEAAGRFPHLLSRGERQRVALAAVLTGIPQVLVLDEPFAGQDAAHVALMLRLCSAYLAEDATRSLLVATHDLERVRPFFAARAGGEIWTLSEGLLHVQAVEGAQGPQGTATPGEHAARERLANAAGGAP